MLCDRVIIEENDGIHPFILFCLSVYDLKETFTKKLKGKRQNIHLLFKTWFLKVKTAFFF